MLTYFGVALSQSDGLTNVALETALLPSYSVQLQHSEDLDTFSACWLIVWCFHNQPNSDMANYSGIFNGLM